MFERLTRIGRQIYQFIESAIRSGLDRLRTSRTLSRMFPEYSEEDVFSDWRELSKAIAKWTEVMGFPEERVIPVDYFERTTLPTPKTFMITVRGKIINQETGEESVVYYTLGFDRPPSKKEIFEKAMEAFNQRSRTGETNWRFKYDRIERMFTGYVP